MAVDEKVAVEVELSRDELAGVEAYAAQAGCGLSEATEKLLECGIQRALHEGLPDMVWDALRRARAGRLSLVQARRRSDGV